MREGCDSYKLRTMILPPENALKDLHGLEPAMVDARWTCITLSHRLTGVVVGMHVGVRAPVLSAGRLCGGGLCRVARWAAAVTVPRRSQVLALVDMLFNEWTRSRSRTCTTGHVRAPAPTRMRRTATAGRGRARFSTKAPFAAKLCSLRCWTMLDGSTWGH